MVFGGVILGARKLSQFSLVSVAEKVLEYGCYNFEATERRIRNLFTL